MNVSRAIGPAVAGRLVAAAGISSPSGDADQERERQEVGRRRAPNQTMAANTAERTVIVDRRKFLIPAPVPMPPSGRATSSAIAGRCW
jgi:hypothetical protein